MRLRISLISFFVSLITTQTAFACTDFRITAQDGTVLITRSMEFATDLKSDIRSAPRGQVFKTTAPDGKAGLSWKSQYGYLYLNGLNMDAALDGINEHGLSFEALYMPGETQYQTVPAGHDSHALPYVLLGQWILGNFKTVDEVRRALVGTYVFEQKIPSLGDVVFPLHYAIYDASGKGLVVEFIGGQMQLHDNVLGIMTNSPTYNWQVTNLRNYMNLSPYSPQPIVVAGMSFMSTGQGAGMVGLPGDISPPSRFVKVSFLMKNALPVPDAAASINLGEHIINNVDIPLGTVRAKQQNAPDAYELTQWVIFKDLTHKVLYYRSYQDMTLRSISMDKIDFSPTAPSFSTPLATGPYIVDMTQKFIHLK